MITKLVNFDFDAFLDDNNLTITALADKINYKYPSVLAMAKRGTVKRTFIGDLEKVFGDCSKYRNTEQRVLQE
jgi:hypothetical protein